MDELNIIMKKFLIQVQYLNAILNDAEYYIEYCLDDERKLVDILNLLEYIHAKLEISSFCIEEIKQNKSNNYLDKICQENDIAIKNFKNDFQQIKEQ
jgi:hypothetical protein